MYGIWNGEKFLVDDNGKLYTADTPEFAEAQMQFLISGGAANLEVRRILPDLSDICVTHRKDYHDPPNDGF